MTSETIRVGINLTPAQESEIRALFGGELGGSRVKLKPVCEDLIQLGLAATRAGGLADVPVVGAAPITPPSNDSSESDVEGL